MFDPSVFTGTKWDAVEVGRRGSWELMMIMALEATMAASTEMAKLKQELTGGTVLKKGPVHGDTWIHFAISSVSAKRQKCDLAPARVSMGQAYHMADEKLGGVTLSGMMIACSLCSPRRLSLHCLENHGRCQKATELAPSRNLDKPNLKSIGP